MPLEIRQESRSEVTVLHLAGELDVYTVRDLRTRVDALDPGAEQVVVDMRGITFLDSAGVTAIVSMLNQARAGGRELGLICPSGHEICRILTVAGLGGELVIEEDLERVCSALGVASG